MQSPVARVAQGQRTDDAGHEATGRHPVRPTTERQPKHEIPSEVIARKVREVSREQAPPLAGHQAAIKLELFRPAEGVYQNRNDSENQREPRPAPRWHGRGSRWFSLSLRF